MRFSGGGGPPPPRSCLKSWWQIVRRMLFRSCDWKGQQNLHHIHSFKLFKGIMIWLLFSFFNRLYHFIFLFVVLFVIIFLKYMKCSRIIVVVFTPPNFRKHFDAPCTKVFSISLNKPQFSPCNASWERQDIRGGGAVSHKPPAFLWCSTCVAVY